ncbi:hypothetical protein Bca4012_064733 [Brassica carinata]|uniref:Uncharacterized protein n=1 Tax=Brassica carinata TaxID=52824 RepID=A0A8X7VMY1_BRACI|nr:hypothetical protein Bca52824_017224 [Brassica carinata]
MLVEQQVQSNSFSAMLVSWREKLVVFLESLATVLKSNHEVVSRFVGLDSGRYLSYVTELAKDGYQRTRLLSCLCFVAITVLLRLIC